MARLIAPNGVEVNASKLDMPILLAAGYKPADEKPKRTARKRTSTKEK